MQLTRVLQCLGNFIVIWLWRALDEERINHKLFGFFAFSFPDQRKNPALYLKWCNVLGIEKQAEKLQKPLVCQNHFNPKDIRADSLKPGSIPRRTQQNHKTSFGIERRKKTVKVVEVKAGHFVEIRPLPMEIKGHPVEPKAFPVGLKALSVATKAFPVEIKTEPYDIITIGALKFSDQQIISISKDEPIDSEAQAPQHSDNDHRCDGDDEDVEFLKSLLKDIKRMDKLQKRIFQAEMRQLR